ncbi:MAG: hypothetical protein GDYSWBUE_001369 [Candidatus Fervidibacterota bacterium]
MGWRGWDYILQDDPIFELQGLGIKLIQHIAAHNIDILVIGVNGNRQCRPEPRHPRTRLEWWLTRLELVGTDPVGTVAVAVELVVVGLAVVGLVAVEFAAAAEQLKHANMQLPSRL